MPTQLQLRRGSTAQTASFIGAPGEVTVDTTKNVLVIHDGVTSGGWPGVSPSAQNSWTANQAFTNISITGNTTTNSLLVTGNLNTGSVTSSNGVYSTNSFNGTFSDGIVMDYVTGNGRISAGTSDNITLYSGGVGTTPIATHYSNGAFAPANTGIFNGTINSTAIKFANSTELAKSNSTAISANTTFNVSEGAVQYWTSNASSNTTLNITWSSGTTMNQVMTVNDSITLAMMFTNGSTAYYPSVYQIDGIAVTPKWQANSAPTGGNANSIDVYGFVVYKTGNNTYTVLASQTQFK
jgi:hypothetical protein